MRIIPELPVHRPAVLEINHLAFNGDDEGQLVEALDRDGDVIASLVAIDVKDEVVGHILFSQLRVIVEGREVIAAALAPMAVTPNRQNQGIGSQLVKHGIDTMKSAEQAAIIVLGHKQFYPRFGFRHDLAQNLSCPFNQHDEFMGLELVEGSLAGKVGTCSYPKAFAAI